MHVIYKFLHQWPPTTAPGNKSFPVLYNRGFFVETGPAMTGLHDIILRAVLKVGPRVTAVSFLGRGRLGCWLIAQGGKGRGSVVQRHVIAGPFPQQIEYLNKLINPGKGGKKKKLISVWKTVTPNFSKVGKHYLMDILKGKESTYFHLNNLFLKVN